MRIPQPISFFLEIIMELDSWFAAPSVGATLNSFFCQRWLSMVLAGKMRANAREGVTPPPAVYSPRAKWGCSGFFCELPSISGCTRLTTIFDFGHAKESGDFVLRAAREASRSVATLAS